MLFLQKLQTMRKILLLLLLVCSFFIFNSCNREGDSTETNEQSYKYKGVYVGKFKHENGNEIGDFNFYVIRKNDITHNVFNIDFNYFIINPNGVKLKDFSIDDNGYFSLSVYSYDNFYNEKYRGKLEGNIVGTQMMGTFELSRNINDPNSSTITKGTFLGNKQ